MISAGTYRNSAAEIGNEKKGFLYKIYSVIIRQRAGKEIETCAAAHWAEINYIIAEFRVAHIGCKQVLNRVHCCICHNRFAVRLTHADVIGGNVIINSADVNTFC